jgi:hypothetical protein
MFSRNVIALVSALALAPVVTMNGIMVAFVSLLAHTAIYLPLIKITDPGLNPSVPAATIHLLRTISHPTATILFLCLCARFWWNPLPEIAVGRVVRAGAYKAANWALVFYIVSQPLPFCDLC